MSELFLVFDYGKDFIVMATFSEEDAREKVSERQAEGECAQLLLVEVKELS